MEVVVLAVLRHPLEVGVGVQEVLPPLGDPLCVKSTKTRYPRALSWVWLIHVKEGGTGLWRIEIDFEII